MKIRNLILLGIFAVLLSCKPEVIGISQCYVNALYDLDTEEEQYRVCISRPDSQGNDQSLEACLMRRRCTENYILLLDCACALLPNTHGCSNEEKAIINSRIQDRREELQEDLDVVWSQCEKIFGGG